MFVIGCPGVSAVLSEEGIGHPEIGLPAMNVFCEPPDCFGGAGGAIACKRKLPEKMDGRDHE